MTCSDRCNCASQFISDNCCIEGGNSTVNTSSACNRRVFSTCTVKHTIYIWHCKFVTPFKSETHHHHPVKLYTKFEFWGGTKFLFWVWSWNSLGSTSVKTIATGVVCWSSEVVWDRGICLFHYWTAIIADENLSDLLRQKCHRQVNVLKFYPCYVLSPFKISLFIMVYYPVSVHKL